LNDANILKYISPTNYFWIRHCATAAIETFQDAVRVCCQAEFPGLHGTQVYGR
jgi:hypothetical protein